jgi:transcriptional/translational regulatory protein YebC/TACO1
MLPYGVAALIEFQTEQKLRVLKDVRSIVGRAGGTVTPTSFLFDKKGKIWYSKQEELGVDDILDEAIEAGALEVDLEDGQIVVETEPSEITAVAQRLEESFSLKLERSEIFYDPKEETLVSLSKDEDIEIGAIVDSIEAEPTLQNLYLNVMSSA